MAKYDYNMIVIGGGSAGLVASLIAAATGAKVALIEKHKMGGDCLNTGCVPSKALIQSAKVAHQMRHADHYGLKPRQPEIDFKSVMDRIHNIIATIEPHDSVERFTGLGVTCFAGDARLTGPHSISFSNADGEQSLTARSIVVATGAGPLVPPIEGLEDIDYLTSDDLWQLQSLPKRLLVLGAGPIGVEMAQAFARLGAQVTLADMTPTILYREDNDVAKIIAGCLTAEGLDIRTEYKLLRFEQCDGESTAVFDHRGEETRIAFDSTLLAFGRKANTHGFGLEELGVTLRQNQTIDANAFLQTNVPSIYVCGDVTGPYQFTHTASHQAWYAAINALFSPIKRFKADYSVIPWATFCAPEVARVGYNEKDADAECIAYETTLYDMADADRAIADSKNIGFIKVLTKPGSDKIIGATIVSENAGELINEFVIAMRHGLGLNKILSTIHIYPTYSEANKLAAGVWRKNHVPAVAVKLSTLFHALRRRL
ncbi:Mercuric reductase [BD1-7 clade bacterium]|uniref:Mercuric reductase n=1 Tax=BD1-7 clade bacterium TaxID=2029982 RepID=A0A5S9MYX1_9GAMM|nr:Mercuric reductase [BD1-7 clade bacterium]CAA0083111.1 Mercuric reductase [BD1-7 clade bacterium]